MDTCATIDPHNTASARQPHPTLGAVRALAKRLQGHTNRRGYLDRMLLAAYREWWALKRQCDDAVPLGDGGEWTDGQLVELSRASCAMRRAARTVATLHAHTPSGLVAKGHALIESLHWDADERSIDEGQSARPVAEMLSLGFVRDALLRHAVLLRTGANDAWHAGDMGDEL